MGHRAVPDALRFANQTFAVEDACVLGCESLRNLMAIAILSKSFSILWLGQREKLAITSMHAMKASRRPLGIADFRYCAIADGIAEFLNKRTSKVFKPAHMFTNEDRLDILQFSIKWL